MNDFGGQPSLPRSGPPQLRQSTLARERLGLTPSEGAQRPSLVVLRGSGGSGKTTLLAQWAEQLSASGERVVWVGLRGEDSGRAGALARIVDALVQHDALPGYAGGSTRFSPERLRDGDIVSPLTPDLAVLEAIVVLDDYHHVADRAADLAIREMILASPGLTVLVSTRTTDDLQSSETAARVPTRVVADTEIAFTSEETRTLAISHGVRDEVVIRKLHAVSRGWPLATRALLLDAVSDGGMTAYGLRTESGRTRFIREFVRTRLSEGRELDFAERVAIVDGCDVGTAATLTGWSGADAAQQLNQFESEGLGLWRAEDGQCVFQLHPMLREALEVSARARLDSDELRAALQRILGPLSDTRPMRAFEIAAEIEDWDAMDRIGGRYAALITGLHRDRTLRLLRALPTDALARHPRLRAARWVMEYGNAATPAAQIRHGLLAVGALLRTRSGTTLEDAGELSIAAAMNRLLGRGERAVELTTQVLHLLDRNASDERLGASDATTLNQAAFTLLIHDRFGEAVVRLDQAAELAGDAGPVGALPALHAHALSAFAHAAAGDLASARSAITLCETLDGQDGWSASYVGAGYRVARGLVALDEWRPDDALLEVEIMADQLRTLEHWPYFAMIDAVARWQQHGAGAGSDGLARMMARQRWRMAPVSHLRDMLRATEITMLLAGGETAQVRRAAKAATTGSGLLRLALARVAMAGGEVEAAASQAARIARGAVEHPRVAAEAHLVEAVALLRAGKPERGTEALRSAGAILHDHDLRLPLMTVPREALDALLGRSGPIPGVDLESVPDVVLHVEPGALLSPAEERVLDAYRRSPNAVRVAEELYLSPHTVRHHLKSIYRKFGVSSGREALGRAQDRGVLSEGGLPD